jgi:hypothetical protein
MGDPNRIFGKGPRPAYGLCRPQKPAMICATDIGVDITDPQVSGVFEGIEQGAGSMTRRIGGTGPGPSTVRQLLLPLGGMGARRTARLTFRPFRSLQ